MAFRSMKNWITAFASLPLASIDKLAWGTRLREIGHMERSTFNCPKVG